MESFVEWLTKIEESSTTRAGIAHWAYPDGYIRSHYPDLWFTPIAADAIQKMAPGPPVTKKTHHVHHETPPDYAIGPDCSPRPEGEKDYSTD